MTDGCRSLPLSTLEEFQRRRSIQVQTDGAGGVGGGGTHTQRSRSVCVCVCVFSVLHNERAVAGMLRTLAIPGFCPLLLQVDIAVGGVVGEGLQNWPVAPQVHQT